MSLRRCDVDHLVVAQRKPVEFAELAVRCLPGEVEVVGAGDIGQVAGAGALVRVAGGVTRLVLQWRTDHRREGVMEFEEAALENWATRRQIGGRWAGGQA